jgi:hypothetical protein
VCYFITIAVPKKADAALSEWRRRGYHLTRHNNEHLTREFPTGFSPWVLTNGHCSCDLVESLKRDKTQVRLRADAVEILQTFVTAAERLFVYIHIYSGDIATEKVAVAGRRLDNLEQLGMNLLPVDTLVEFKGPNPTSTHATGHRTRSG